MKLSFITFNLY